MIEKLGYVIKRKHKSYVDKYPDEKSTVSHTQSENKLGTILQIRQQSRETQRLLDKKVSKLNFLSNQTVNNFQKMNEVQNSLFKQQNNKQFRNKSYEILSVLKEKATKDQEEKIRKIQFLKEQQKESMIYQKERKQAWLNQVKQMNKQNKDFYKSLIIETQQIQMDENHEFCKQIRKIKRVSTFHLEKKQRYQKQKINDKRDQIQASISLIQQNLQEKKKQLEFYQSKIQSEFQLDSEKQNNLLPQNTAVKSQIFILKRQLKTQKNNSVISSPVQSNSCHYSRQKPY